MILDDFFAEKDRFPLSLLIIVIHRKVENIPRIIINPVLVAICCKHRMLHRKYKGASRTEISIHLANNFFIISYIMKRKGTCLLYTSSYWPLL